MRKLPWMIGAAALCVGTAACTPFPRASNTASAKETTSARHGTLRDTVYSKTADSSGHLEGDAAQAEMKARSGRIARSSIDVLDGAAVTVVYDDGARAVTRTNSWGKTYEFFPPPPPAGSGTSPGK